MVSKTYEKQTGIFWILYGIVAFLACVSTTLLLLSRNEPLSLLATAVAASSFILGLYLLPATLLAHFDYLYELRQRRSIEQAPPVQERTRLAQKV